MGNGPFGAYLMLIVKRDQAYVDRGECDPATLIAIDEQVQGDPRLSPGQRILLHQSLQNRLRRAGSGWG
jgi:hypothetical protein